MAPDIRLDQYVQRKVNRHGKEYFFFRKVTKGIEARISLPHPFDDGYRLAYNTAWQQVFGVSPEEPSTGQSVKDLCIRHEASAAFFGLASASKYMRRRALGLLTERFGQFEAFEIRPLHMQALYDSISKNPPTANRIFDDVSKIFSWGVPRGFSTINPAAHLDRIQSGESYEPWPTWALEKFIAQGQWHMTRALLMALYTGQRRGDVLAMTFQDIRDGVWHLSQGKTGNKVPVSLHPIAQTIVDDEWEWGKSQSIIDPKRPVLRNSRGNAWGSGFGASWNKEMLRLNLKGQTPRLTYHGLRTTNATLIASAVAQNPEKFGGIERVQSLLGHHSKRMSEHYARRAKTEHLNNDSVLLIPDFGNPLGNLGNPKATKTPSA
ncbi:MAG: tyrosine-type recombinase/integrase [Alphaproteobacteria bacterium]|nr:tyrosine-type recombinase/integrase [Alphaproteobacteria bacterium]